MSEISLGLDTFGDVSLGPDGKPQAMDRTLREVLDQAKSENRATNRVADAIARKRIGR